MKKIVVMFMALYSSIYAQNFLKKPMGFDAFLKEAIQKSPYLESSSLGIIQAKEQGSALTRYANPNLELEYSQFDPSTAAGGDSDNGYRVSYSQPIRLWSVGSDKDALSARMTQRAETSYTQQRAVFTRELSLRFTQYAQQKMLLVLGDEELEIAKTIYDISKARYDSGTISRGLMLQSQVDYQSVKIANSSLRLAVNNSYYELLGFAGINEEINLETQYSFTIAQNSVEKENPSLALFKAQQAESLSQARVQDNAVEWMNVFAEYESEPEQDITRLGMNFPLAFFNTRSQEKKIADLEASKAELLLDNASRRLQMQTAQLSKARQVLQAQKISNEAILETETELLEMFQEGYKIANINLLQLQDIKNRVIETKERLIQIKTALDQNAIITNYNQGNYNE